MRFKRVERSRRLDEEEEEVRAWRISACSVSRREVSIWEGERGVDLELCGKRSGSWCGALERARHWSRSSRNLGCVSTIS